MNTNRITLLICAAVAALAFGCGQAEDQDTPDLDTAGDEIELGTAEQPLNAQGPNWGISTAASHNACNTTSTGQVCSVLGHAAAVKYCYGNGVVDSDVAGFDSSVFARLNSGQSKFQFSRQFASGSPAQNRANCEAASVVNAELKIRGNSTCTGSASGTSVTNFACLALGTLTLLGESPATPGTWNKHSQGGITIDYTDLGTLVSSLGVTPAQAQCVKLHGLMHSAEAYVGIGGQATSVNLISSSNDINPKTVSTLIDATGCNYLNLSSREQCEANSFNTTNPSLWGFSSTVCP